MKRYIYILCVVLIGVFASCSKGEIGGQTPLSNQVTLKVTADEGLQTRSNTAMVDRFAIEVYTDATYTTAANVFSDGTNKADNTNGIFTMVLDRTQAYYCLLWADKLGVYDIASLKEVTLTGKAVEAWHGTKIIEAKVTAALDVKLSRAVSKISLMETGQLKSGSTLKLNFSQPTKFNVANATTSIPDTRPEELILIEAAVDGAVDPVKLNSADIFVLSSVATADLTDLTFKFNKESDFTIPQAPLKANFNTNINGNYTSMKDVTFTITADAEWGTPDSDVVISVYAIGDLYPDAAAPIGVVFWVDDTDVTYNKRTKTSAIGKIMSLDEAKIQWSTEAIVTGTNGISGAANMLTVLGLSTYSAATYPAFAWCAAKNETAPEGISWYVPVTTELQHRIYPNKVLLDASLRAAGKTPFTDYRYWMSAEQNSAKSWCVTFNDGQSWISNKDSYYHVRGVSAF